MTRSLLIALLGLLIVAPAFAGWTQVPGGLVQVSVGSSRYVWGVNANDQIWQYTGGGWTQIPGALTNVAVGADGAVWGVDRQDQIYRRDGSNWTHIPGGLVQISVGNTLNVWGVNRNDQVWRWNGSTWQQMPGSLTWVAVGSDGAVWGVNRQGQIWRWVGSTWTNIPFAFTQFTQSLGTPFGGTPTPGFANISVGNDSTVWGIDSYGRVWKWGGKDWTQMEGTLRQIAVAGDGTLWGVNPSGQILTGNLTTIAVYQPPTMTLTISPRPTGGAVWISSGTYANKILCGDFDSSGAIRTDCSLALPTGTSITLDATVFHTDQYVYNAFTGACAGQNARCNLVMDSNKTASATFRTAHVNATPSTDGYFTSSAGPEGDLVPMAPNLNCGTTDGGPAGTCTAIVRPGTPVTFTANPRTGYIFSAWGGACAGQANPCTLTVNDDASISATYKNVGTYAVTASSPAFGMSINAAGMNCRGSLGFGGIVGTFFGAASVNAYPCTANYTRGAAVAFTANADLGYYFTNWGGDCAGQGNPCTLQMNGNKTISATASATQAVTLTVSPAPANGCVYTQNSAVICGDFGPNNPRTACSLTMNKGTVITVYGDPFYNTGYHWASFSGACAGQAGGVCTLTMDSDKTMSATFSK